MNTVIYWIYVRTAHVRYRQVGKHFRTNVTSVMLKRTNALLGPANAAIPAPMNCCSRARSSFRSLMRLRLSQPEPESRLSQLSLDRPDNTQGAKNEAA